MSEQRSAGEAVGLVAGAGRLPEVLARAAHAHGHPVICAQMAGDPAGLPTVAEVYRRLDLGALQEVLSLFHHHHVRDVLVAGQFSRAALVRPLSGDALFQAMVQRAGDRRDQPFMEALARLGAEAGMRVVDQLTFAADLVPGPGLVAGAPLSSAEQRDVEVALPIARLLAAQDVGQTVVLKDGVILAVEAAEGTDATIRRGGAMARGAVAVKVSRPHQDPRFDVPTVGPETIEALSAIHGRVLAVEARRTIVVDRETLVTAAAAAGISVVAIDAPPLVASDAPPLRAANPP